MNTERLASKYARQAESVAKESLRDLEKWNSHYPENQPIFSLDYLSRFYRIEKSLIRKALASSLIPDQVDITKHILSSGKIGMQQGARLSMLAVGMRAMTYPESRNSPIANFALTEIRKAIGDYTSDDSISLRQYKLIVKKLGLKVCAVCRKRSKDLAAHVVSEHMKQSPHSLADSMSDIQDREQQMVDARSAGNQLRRYEEDEGGSDNGGGGGGDEGDIVGALENVEAEDEGDEEDEDDQEGQNPGPGSMQGRKSPNAGFSSVTLSKKKGFGNTRADGYRCERCGFLAPSEIALSAHLKIVHNIDNSEPFKNRDRRAIQSRINMLEVDQAKVADYFERERQLKRQTSETTIEHPSMREVPTTQTDTQFRGLVFPKRGRNRILPNPQNQELEDSASGSI